MRELCVTESEYGLYGKEIRTFIQFYSQTAFFGKIEG
jgi:hypothetical protein